MVCSGPVPQISGSMTAAELTCQVLDLRNIHFDKNDYWSCWVVNEKEEIGETWGTGVE